MPSGQNDDIDTAPPGTKALPYASTCTFGADDDAGGGPAGGTIDDPPDDVASANNDDDMRNSYLASAMMAAATVPLLDGANPRWGRGG